MQFICFHDEFTHYTYLKTWGLDGFMNDSESVHCQIQSLKMMVFDSFRNSRWGTISIYSKIMNHCKSAFTVNIGQV